MTLFHSTGVVVAGRFLGMLSVLAMNALLARTISTPALGQYFVATSILFVFAGVGRLGLQQGVVQLVASGLARGDYPYVRRSITLCIRISLLGLLALALMLISPVGNWLLTTGFSSESLSDLRPILAIWLVFEGLRLVVAEAFRGLHSIFAATLLGDPGRNIALFLGIAWYWEIWRPDGDLAGAVLVTAIVSVVLCVIGYAVLSTKLRTWRRSSIPNLSRVARMTVPLTLVSISSVVMLQGDVWAAGLFQSDTSVALYGAATRLSMLLTVPLFVAVAVLSPGIARFAATDRECDLQTLLRGSATIALAPTAIAAFVFIVFGRPLMTMVYGAPFADAADTLSILSIGQVVNVATGLCGIVLVMAGRERHAAYVFLPTSFLTAVVVGLVASRASIDALALSFTACLSIQNIALLLMTRRQLGIWSGVYWRPPIARAVLSSIPLIREAARREEVKPA